MSLELRDQKEEWEEVGPEREREREDVCPERGRESRGMSVQGESGGRWPANRVVKVTIESFLKPVK